MHPFYYMFWFYIIYTTTVNSLKNLLDTTINIYKVINKKPFYQQKWSWIFTNTSKIFPISGMCKICLTRVYIYLLINIFIMYIFRLTFFFLWKLINQFLSESNLFMSTNLILFLQSSFFISTALVYKKILQETLKWKKYLYQGHFFTNFRPRGI